MTDKELDEFIEEADRWAEDSAWWIDQFCEEAADIGRQLKQLRYDFKELKDDSLL